MYLGGLPLPRNEFNDLDNARLPMVEIFETIEGEGKNQGYLTTFVRTYHCNLRCTWCDTPYSYSPAQPEFYMTVREIVEEVWKLKNKKICLTGGEPLIHGQKSKTLIKELAQIDFVDDIHIETNGAIDLTPFERLRQENDFIKSKVRFVMDYKLPDSGENKAMIHENFSILDHQDEIKFVIASEDDFLFTKYVIDNFYSKGQILFSPVWESMEPKELVSLIRSNNLKDVRLNLQLHKVIWDPDLRGV